MRATRISISSALNGAGEAVAAEVDVAAFEAAACSCANAENETLISNAVATDAPANGRRDSKQEKRIRVFPQTVGLEAAAGARPTPPASEDIGCPPG